MSPDPRAPFRDQTVLLAGATGAVGSALLERLMAMGARAGVAVRRAAEVEPTARRYSSAQVLAGVVGATDGEAAAGFVKGVEDSLGAIAALITTAGAFAAAPIGAERTADVVRLFEANVLAAITLTRAVVAPMKRRRAGALVYTGARAALEPQPGMALYRAAKAALHAYAESAAVELAPFGIRVAVVAPGTIDTAANRAAMPGVAPGEWHSIDRVVDALLAAAGGVLTDAGPGPLYPLR